jgi:hypothetical protein
VPILDIGGDLVLPGLVDGHMHLDKTLMGLSWMPHIAGPTRMSRIETDKTILQYLAVFTEERAGNLIETCVARGTGHLRTHVDIDLESRLAKLGGERAAPRPGKRADRRLSATRGSCAAPVSSTSSTRQCPAAPLNSWVKMAQPGETAVSIVWMKTSMLALSSAGSQQVSMKTRWPLKIYGSNKVNEAP